jgi:hypothetical protein
MVTSEFFVIYFVASINQILAWPMHILM